MIVIHMQHSCSCSSRHSLCRHGSHKSKQQLSRPRRSKAGNMVYHPPPPPNPSNSGPKETSVIYIKMEPRTTQLQPPVPLDHTTTSNKATPSVTFHRATPIMTSSRKATLTKTQRATQTPAVNFSQGNSRLSWRPPVVMLQGEKRVTENVLPMSHVKIKKEPGELGRIAMPTPQSMSSNSRPTLAVTSKPFCRSSNSKLPLSVVLPQLLGRNSNSRTRLAVKPAPHGRSSSSRLSLAVTPAPHDRESNSRPPLSVVPGPLGRSSNSRPSLANSVPPASVYKFRRHFRSRKPSVKKAIRCVCLWTQTACVCHI